MAKENRTKAASARSLDRKEEALALRRAGHSYRAIASLLSISKSRAHELVSEGLEDAREQIAAASSALLVEEVSRLDGMLKKVYPAAEGGDLQAVDRVIKIIERRAKLLGIEAPVRIETTGRDGAPIEVSSKQTIDPSKLSNETLRQLLDARFKPD
jgi:hypothetical protein